MHAVFIYPVCSTEVDCFGKVISLIKTAVVGSWKGNDKLPSTLIGPNHLSINI